MAVVHAYLSGWVGAFGTCRAVGARARAELLVEGFPMDSSSLKD
jgi:hypothetical protein